MYAFLNQVAEYIYQNYKENPEEICIVLPNKRGSLFLKRYLAKVYQKTIWLPSIISAEDFINELSGVQNLEDVDLICRLYESYITIYKDKAEPFDSFAKWGNLILQDFNEIDRYLADAIALYNNLRDIKEIENWSLSEEELTDFQKNYIEFMGQLGNIYTHFTAQLLKNKEAYQGLSYKEAVKNFQFGNYVNRYKKILFCGFNALNKAETIIFSKLCTSGRAEMIWDADSYYAENTVQEAGLFLRKNMKSFNKNSLSFTGNYFKEKKRVDIIAVPKQIGQAQIVSNLINELLDNGTAPDSIAVVLANEKMLWPVLKMLPGRIEHVNITMEYPIKYTAPYSFIDLILKIQIGYEKQYKQSVYIYYKDFLSLLRHTFYAEYAVICGIKNTNEIINRVLEKNYAFINEKLLKELYGDGYSQIECIFTVWKTAGVAADSIGLLIKKVKEHYLNSELNSFKSIELEYLEVLIKNFNRVNDFIKKYNYFDSLKSFKILFNQIVGTGSAAFIGEPLKGLQIMGVLETRTLDFENVIFVSVNEGVLPSGKVVNSFIPNDLKRYFGLPLYSDKDAIYSYHFYRLMQRTSNCFITYDTETDTFGKGERSRFVSQLQLELPKYNQAIEMNEYIAQNNLPLEKSDTSIRIKKEEHSVKKIHEKAFHNTEFSGLSPSSLLSYKSCSLKFFFRYGVGLKETQELEESAESNTFGSILHEALENLYKPYVKSRINSSVIKHIKTKIPGAVETSFLNYFSKAEAFFGKNLLQQNVLKIYIEKLLDFDIEQLKVGKLEDLEIISVEEELGAELILDFNGAKRTVYLKGKADRIDDYNNEFRIIDYKSSVNSKDKFEFAGFNEMISNKAYDKMLQLFLYAWMAYKGKKAEAGKIKPCIIPFKVFESTPCYITKNKQPMFFNEEIFDEFEHCLSQYVSEIISCKGEFSQTEDAEICEYCAYKSLCNK